MYIYSFIHVKNCMHILFEHICHGQTKLYGLWPPTIGRDSLQWVNLNPYENGLISVPTCISWYIIQFVILVGNIYPITSDFKIQITSNIQFN